MLLAVMDLGSNSFKMTVAQWAPDVSRNRPFRVLHKERHPIQLGAGVFTRGSLSIKDQKEAFKALEKMKARLRDFSSPILRVVATSAIRDAANGRDFVATVRAKLGIPIEVISGLEEARLIAQGLAWEYPQLRRGVLVDIGGGSSEVATFGKAWKEPLFHSFKVGSVRIATMFCDSKNRLDVAKARRFTAQQLSRLTPPSRIDRLIGSAGSIQSLGRILTPSRSTPLVRRSTLDRWIDKNLKTSLNDLREDFQLTPSRARVVVPGAIILSEVMRWLKIEEITVTGMTLRDGVMVDLVRTWQGSRDKLLARSSRHRAGVVRSERDRELLAQLEAAALRFQVDLAHARHIATLAVSLFDQMVAAGFKFSPDERRCLLVAAYLHDIGKIVDASGHQKHSAYLVRNIVLSGISVLDAKKSALIALYHRKESPPKRDPLPTDLGGKDAEQVRQMAALLRLVDGLDEYHTQNIIAIVLSFTRKQAALEMIQRNSEPLNLTYFREKAAYFEEHFGLKVVSFVHPKRK